MENRSWIVDAGFYCSVLCCLCHFINSLYWQQKQASIACCQSKQYLHQNRREELDASSILRLIAEKTWYSLQIDYVTFQKQNDGNRAGENVTGEGIPGPDKLKKNPLAHWASKFFFNLPSWNSYLPRICPAQILTCSGFGNRNRSPNFNFMLTSPWN